MSWSALTAGRVREDARELTFFGAALATSFLVALLALHPSTMRIAVVFVAACAIAGFGFRAPQALLITLVAWLAALGLVRRVVTLSIGSRTGTDPLLLVGPLALVTLALIAARAGAFSRLTALSKSVLALGAVALFETLNPVQGGLRVGLAGLLLMFVPMLAFWVGRALVDDRLLRRVLLAFGTLALPAGAYGFWQTFGGFPRWDATWISSVNFVALNVDGTVRPFSLFSSFAEYGFYLAIGIVVWLAFGRSLPRFPVTVFAVAFLAVALVYESARLVFILLAAAIGVGFAALRGVRPVVALTTGVLAVAALTVAAGHFAGTSSTSGEASSLVAHEAQGLADPFGRGSTGTGHLSLLLNGLRSGFTHPAGSGVGAVSIAASKFGGTAAPTEADPSNAAVALGLPGLLAYLGVAVWGLLAVYRVAIRRRDALAVAGLMVVVATSLEWLNGGQYAVAFVPWLVLGWADRQPSDLEGRARRSPSRAEGA